MSKRASVSPASADDLTVLGSLAQRTASTSAPPTAGNGSNGKDAGVPRPFRSRKLRPCDACRRQKNRCVVNVSGEPCVECKQTGKTCTFLAPVPERKPPARPPAAPSPPTGTVSPLAHSQTIASLSALFHPAASNPTASLEDGLETLAAAAWNDRCASTKRARSSESSSSARPVAPGARLNGSGTFSIENECPGQMEPCAITVMLTDDLLPVRSVASTGQGEETLGHRQVSNDSTPMFFTLLRKPAHRIQTDDFDRGILRRVRTSLALLPQHFDEQAALSLYLTSSHPAFPILPTSPAPTLDNLPPALLALIFATALDHSPATNYASKPIWQNIKEARVGDTSLELPKLAGVATALLELSARPVLDERGDYLLLAKAIAQAQLLGLHISSEAWVIPQWEKSLRLRLWWCLRMHDSWSSFLNSRPSHLQTGNTSVPIPDPSCTESLDGNTISSNSAIAFHYLCRLAVQVGFFQNDLCTIEKLRLAKAGQPTVLRSVEKELTALEAETRYLVSDQLRPAPAGAYCFRFMLLGFRCMIRRVAIELKAGIGGAFLPDADTLSLFGNLVDFVASLQSDAFHGYWLPYSCHVLSSAVSSLIRLSLASISSGPHDPAPAITVQGSASSQPVHLLARLCAVLAAARSEHGWDVSEWALTRAGNVASRLRTVAGLSNDAADDYQAIVHALEGRVGSPVAMPSVDPGLATLTGGEILWNVDLHGLPDLDEWLNELNSGGGSWAQDAGSDGYIPSGLEESFSSW